MTARASADQCELSCNKDSRNKPQEHLRSNTAPSQPIGTAPKKNGTQAERDRHRKQLKYHAGAIEALNVLEPLRRPEPLRAQAVPMQDAESGATRQNRGSA